MANGGNLCDPTRDPRRLHRPASNIEMADAISRDPAPSGTPNSLGITFSNTSEQVDSPSGDVGALRSRVNELVARVASQGAEKAKLQREKSDITGKLRDTHTRLTSITQSHATVTASHAKRLNEKNDLVTENAGLVESNATLREHISAYLQVISQNETTIMELRNENDRLQERVAMLELERDILQKRVRELEAKEEECESSSVSEGELREPYRPRHSSDAGLQVGGYDEEFETKGGHDRRKSYRLSDTYRPSRRHSNRNRSAREDARDRGQRFQGGAQPPTGPRAERR